jgi:hypothetical protein
MSNPFPDSRPLSELLDGTSAEEPAESPGWVHTGSTEPVVIVWHDDEADAAP